MKLNQRLSVPSIDTGRIGSWFKELRSKRSKLKEDAVDGFDDDNDEHLDDVTEVCEENEQDERAGLRVRLKTIFVSLKQKLKRSKVDKSEHLDAQSDEELNAESVPTLTRNASSKDRLSPSDVETSRVATERSTSENPGSTIYRLDAERLIRCHEKIERRKMKENLGDRRSEVRLTASGEPERDRRLANRQANSQLFKKAG